MEFEIIKIKQLSGKKAQIYSVILGQEDQSVFEQFLQNNYSEYPTEIEDIVSKLKIMATKTGAAEHFFKLNEGKPGDGVCALFDSPDKKLRIYCIRFANVAIVVGGGGYKPKNIRAYQESSSLKKEAETMVRISRIISEAIKNKDIHLEDNVKIAEGIKRKGLSQKEFAEKMSKRPSEISKWLRGDHNFTTSTLFDIEDVLNIHLIDINEYSHAACPASI